MATIGSTFLNLIDVMRAEGNPEGATVVEMLHKLSPFVQDAVVTSCNMGTKHRHGIRTGLPSVAWGQLYTGIPQSKSTTQQVDDTTGFVEGLSTVDKRLLDIADNPAATRLSEAESFMESMIQEAESTCFYGNSKTDPKKFDGLATRYSALTGAGSSSQVVNGGGVGSDNTSIWFVTHSDRATTLLTPKGLPGGLSREDKGEQRVTDGSGNAYYVMEELFRWHLGIAVRDWRTNARICNIDVSNMQAGSVDLYALMRKAYHKLRQVRFAKDYKDPEAAGVGRTVIYCNADVYEALDALSTNNSNTAFQLRPMELEGREVMTYRGMPIRKTDALLNTETLVA